jgi:hypothetical protein
MESKPVKQTGSDDVYHRSLLFECRTDLIVRVHLRHWQEEVDFPRQPLADHPSSL